MTNIEQWQDAALATLRGAPLSSLARTTEDGLKRGPLFTADDLPGQLTEMRRANDPHLGERPWHIAAFIDHPDLARSNTDALTALTGGASALMIAADSAGAAGTAVRKHTDWARLLDKVHLDLAPIFLMPTSANFEHAATLAPYIERHAQAEKMQISFGYSPMKLSSAAITKIGALAHWAKAFAGTAHVLTVNAAALHEYGASDVQELAGMLAITNAYIRALTEDGHDIAAAFGTLNFALAAGCNAHETIAKFRAARGVLAQLATAYGYAEPAQIIALPSRRSLASQDVWANLLRQNSSNFGAVLGGADICAALPFTMATGERAGLSSSFARRYSQNLQLMQMEESHLGRVQDVAAGSHFHENLTDALARAAWEHFQEIESGGGWEAERSTFKRAITKMRKARMTKIDDASTPLVGITQFVKPDVRRADRRPAVSKKAAAGENWIEAHSFAAAIDEAKSGRVSPPVAEPYFPPRSDVSGAEQHNMKAQS